MKKASFLFFIFSACILYAQNSSLVSVNIPSGEYNSDQYILLSASENDINLFYRFLENINDNWTEYSGGFRLGAAAGEERHYGLQVRGIKNGQEIFLNDYSYLIDKLLPKTPLPDKAPGLYDGAVSLSFTNAGNDYIYYSINKPLQSGQKIYDGTPIKLEGKQGSTSQYTILSYSKDSAGNVSALSKFEYTIGTQPGIVTNLDVLSPVSGLYNNRQMLYIDSGDFEWIRYSVTSVSPAEDGIEYQFPVLLPYTGTVRLYIDAKPLNSSKIISKSITFSVAENNLCLPDKNSGIYNQGFKIRFPQQVEYSYDNGKINSDSKSDSIDLVHTTESVNNIIINYRPVSDPALNYRLFYIIDSRKPYTPVINSDITPPVNRDITVSLSADADSTIFYTTDGSTPDSYANYYRGPFVLKLPEGITKGSIIIKAKSFGRNGLSSIESSKLVFFDREKPGRPYLKTVSENSQTVILQAVTSEAGSSVYFEISSDGSDPPDPDTGSPVLYENLVLSVPNGGHFKFLIKLAAADKAGNISEVYTSEPVVIDHQPPAAPAVAFSSSAVILSGSGDIYYNMTSDGSIPAPASVNSHKYSNPVSINPAAGNVYLVRAVCVDSAGNVSAQSKITEISAGSTVSSNSGLLVNGVENGGLYNSDLVISVGAVDPAMTYYYTLDGSSPDSNSPVFEKTLSVSGKEGEEKYFTLKILPYSNSENKYAEITTISFTIDMKAPPAPQLDSIDEINRTSKNVLLDPPAVSGDYKIFYSLSDQSGNISSSAALEFDQPLKLSCSPGKEVQYFLRIWSKDSAGNVSKSSKLYTFIIDKILPETPVPALSAEKNSAGYRTVELTAPEGDIYYELTSDGSYPPTPGLSSPKYTRPVPLPEIEGETVSYILQAVAVDSVGNISDPGNFFTITVSDRQIEEPGPPYIQNFNSEKIVLFSWNTNPDYQLYYSVNMNSFENNAYELYTGPVEVAMSETDNDAELRYYYQDFSGNRSSVRKTSIGPGTSGSTIFSGVSDGAYYNSAVKLLKSVSGTVKYEISTRSAPSGLSEFSAVMPDFLSFDAADGEEVKYHIRAGLIDSNGNITLEDTISFTIDKSEPLPPSVNSRSDKLYFNDTASIDFIYNKGETVYYLISDADYPNQVSYNKFTGTVILKSSGTESEKYILKAYSEDPAGNQSQIKTWQIIIESLVVYVSSEKGTDSGDGSRDNPFETFSHAVSYCMLAGRKTLHLDSGNYYTDSVTEITSDLVIRGSLDSGNDWNISQNRTVIDFNGPYSSLKIKNGNVDIGGVDFYSQDSYISELINVSGGSVSINDSEITKKGSSLAAVIRLGGGSIDLSDSKINIDNCSGGTVVSADSAALELGNTVIAGSEASEPLTLLEIRNCENAEISDSSFFPGNAKKTVALKIINSAAAVLDSAISSGTGAQQATALEISDSTLTIEKSMIDAVDGTRVSTLITSSGSELEILRCRFTSYAETGILLVNSRDSLIHFQGNECIIADTNEFSYLFKSWDSSVFINNSGFIIGSTGDFQGFSISNGSTEIINNTVISAGSSGLNYAVRYSGVADLALLNNIIISRGDPGGTAVLLKSMQINADIRANNVYGFTDMLGINSLLYEVFSDFIVLPGQNYKMRIAENMYNPADQLFDIRDNIYFPRSGSVLINRGVNITSDDYEPVDFLGTIRPNGTSYISRNDIGYIETGP